MSSFIHLVRYTGHKNCYHTILLLLLSIIPFQMLMNVPLVAITVTKTPSVRTLLVVLNVPASQATLDLERSVTVSRHSIVTCSITLIIYNLRTFLS